jgi:hypothetical protein
LIFTFLIHIEDHKLSTKHQALQEKLAQVAAVGMWQLEYYSSP